MSRPRPLPDPTRLDPPTPTTSRPSIPPLRPSNHRRCTDSRISDRSLSTSLRHPPDPQVRTDFPSVDHVTGYGVPHFRTRPGSPSKLPLDLDESFTLPGRTGLVTDRSLPYLFNTGPGSRSHCNSNNPIEISRLTNTVRNIAMVVEP